MMDATLASLLNHIYELEMENSAMKEYIQAKCPPPAPKEAETPTEDKGE
jgi:hypothetical protein